MSNVNPSASQPEGWGLLRVDPERRFSTSPSKPGPGAVERVKAQISNEISNPSEGIYLRKHV
jgi:hypothetical protein